MKISSPFNIGIPEAARKGASIGLGLLLADSYTLYLKTHNFHWNVTGAMFQTLHRMFEGQYLELAVAIDTIAERIRALGFPVPATFEEYSELTSIKTEKGVLDFKHMIQQLIDGHEAVIRTARTIFQTVNASQDLVTVDLLTQRLNIHEKTAWMLRSLLDESRR